MVLESLEPITEDRGKAVILSDDTPSTLTNITGSDVDGLPDDYILAVGSAIVTPDGTFIAYEDGQFSATGAAAVPIGG